MNQKGFQNSAQLAKAIIAAKAAMDNIPAGYIHAMTVLPEPGPGLDPKDIAVALDGVFDRLTQDARDYLETLERIQQGIAPVINIVLGREE